MSEQKYTATSITTGGDKDFLLTEEEYRKVHLTHPAWSRWRIAEKDLSLEDQLELVYQSLSVRDTELYDARQRISELESQLEAKENEMLNLTELWSIELQAKDEQIEALTDEARATDKLIEDLNHQIEGFKETLQKQALDELARMGQEIEQASKASVEDAIKYLKNKEYTTVHQDYALRWMEQYLSEQKAD